MAKIYLFLLLTACIMSVIGTSKFVLIKHSVQVELLKPWYIKFSIPRSDHFEPSTLTATIGADRKVIEFSSYKDHDYQMYRNILPISNLNLDVPIQLYLDYVDPSWMRQLKNINFTYIISAKKFDILNIEVYTLSTDVVPTTQDDDLDYMDLESEAISVATTTVAKKEDTNECQMLYETALEVGEFKLRLKLTGEFPNASNPRLGLHELFDSKLQLPKLMPKIKEAHFKYYEDGSRAIIFEMTTPREVIEILHSARKTPSLINIETTDEDFEILHSARKSPSLINIETTDEDFSDLSKYMRML